jgi:hypothetical protein
MKLVMSRNGAFDPVNMVGKVETDRCGQPHMKTLNYSVEIEATDEHMSPEGFVIENGRIHDYFLKKFCSGRPWEAISCERMAINSAMDIGRLLIRENISVISVTTTMVGSNDARIKATWQRSDDKYKYRPRLKLKKTRAKRAANAHGRH